MVQFQDRGGLFVEVRIAGEQPVLEAPGVQGISTEVAPSGPIGAGRAEAVSAFGDILDRTVGEGIRPVVR